MSADKASADCILIREYKVATPGRGRVEHRSFSLLRFTLYRKNRPVTMTRRDLDVNHACVEKQVVVPLYIISTGVPMA
jgi:hypothetical protein